MALKTLGTNATTSLFGFVVGFNDTIAADLASISIALKGDPPGWSDGFPAVTSAGLVTGQGTNRTLKNQAYVKTGLLYVPGRGTLQLKLGDFVCWDTTTGWPIVISGDAAANGPYSHS